MISLKTLRKSGCPFAICIVMSIAAVISCNFLCNVGLISFSRQSPIEASTGHGHEQSQGHHTLGHQNAHSHHEAAEHHHESPNEEGCCDDLTQRFYSSLVNAADVQVRLIHAEVYKLIGTITFMDLNEIHVKRYLLLASKFEHRPNGPPEYSGHRIRVLFCSLLI